MKKLLLTGIMCCVGLAAMAQKPAAGKKTGDAATMTFKVVEHDFGTISDKGKVSYSYQFTNTGSCPLVVTKVMVSCKCMDVEYPKKPVAPGAKGYITVTYNPRKQNGVFYKALQVYSNDPAGRRVITVRGKVRGSEE